MERQFSSIQKVWRTIAEVLLIGYVVIFLLPLLLIPGYSVWKVVLPGLPLLIIAVGLFLPGKKAIAVSGLILLVLVKLSYFIPMFGNPEVTFTSVLSALIPAAMALLALPIILDKAKSKHKALFMFIGICALFGFISPIEEWVKTGNGITFLAPMLPVLGLTAFTYCYAADSFKTNKAEKARATVA